MPRKLPHVFTVFCLMACGPSYGQISEVALNQVESGRLGFITAILPLRRVDTEPVLTNSENDPESLSAIPEAPYAWAYTARFGPVDTGSSHEIIVRQSGFMVGDPVNVVFTASGIVLEQVDASIEVFGPLPQPTGEAAAPDGR